MELFIIISFAILGAIIGSFLNVVILRHNTGKTLGGRSGCFTCGKALGWYELIPMISYLLQGGKCVKCKSIISKQYIFVEALTAALFASVAARILLRFDGLYDGLTILNLLISLAAVSLLVVIFVYDLRHKIIPDAFSYGFAALALARLVLYYQSSLFVFPGFLDLLAGPLMALPFAFIWYVSKGQWMGFGDAKLALGIGWFLGLAGAISAICIAFWAGAAIGVGLLLAKRFFKSRYPLSMKSEIPFAPFLIFGLLIVYFFPMDLFHINDFLSLV